MFWDLEFAIVQAVDACLYFPWCDCGLSLVHTVPVDQRIITAVYSRSIALCFGWNFSCSWVCGLDSGWGVVYRHETCRGGFPGLHGRECTGESRKSLREVRPSCICVSMLGYQGQAREGSAVVRRRGFMKGARWDHVKNSRFCRGSDEECDGVVFLLRVLDEEDEEEGTGASWETPWTVSLMASLERQKSTWSLKILSSAGCGLEQMGQSQYWICGSEGSVVSPS